MFLIFDIYDEGSCYLNEVILLEIWILSVRNLKCYYAIFGATTRRALILDVSLHYSLTREVNSESNVAISSITIF